VRLAKGKWPWPALALWGVLSCGPGVDTSEGIARQFMDRYYVAIDLTGAKKLCTGLALKKINKELELTQGQDITSDTRKPHIRYSLLSQKKVGKFLMIFLFENEIHVKKMGVYKKRCQIALRKREQDWKVSHFKDYDA